ncbi:MAG TPA: hypothetical protein VG937_36835 [Polyangiaceae bacterium]|nr:hypothetical protein [Polyangiaceae bacterium]
MPTRARAQTERLSLGPWLWGARVDLSVFLGSALAALVLSLCAHAGGFAVLPEWGWLLLVLGVDVAHVHATWFRTYFDREELARHPLRYALVPLAVYGAAFGAYRAGPLMFWRILAYLAVFHFIRQQVGWVALYRKKAGASSLLERVVDEAAIWAATLYPLFEWHLHVAEKGFSWFVPGDFVGGLPLAPFASVARALWVASLALFFARELLSVAFTRRAALGKVLIVATTAATWYLGIVPNEGDFVFTALNVIPHGVPYVWLLFTYTRERSQRAPGWALGQVVAGGFAAFAAVLIGCAFFEQFAWDRFAEHDHAWLFGEGALLPAWMLSWLVPLLALPQATHYVLDGLLWRRAESRVRPAQLAALGFTTSPAGPARLAPAVSAAIQGDSL